MLRTAIAIVFVCLLGASANGWAQSVSSSGEVEWQPFDAPTIALQSGAGLVLGAGFGYLAYLGFKDCPSLGCVAGAFTIPATIGGGGLAVGLIGLGMGSESADIDFYSAVGGYGAGFVIGLLTMYPFFVEEDSDGDLIYETFAVPWATGVLLGTAGAVIGYNLSADIVYQQDSSSQNLVLRGGPGETGLSLRFAF